MKTLLTLLISVLLFTPCFSQQDANLASPDEISYRGDIAYFKGSPYTGLLIDDNTNKAIGEFRNGRKDGLFVEYFSNGKMKNERRYVYGVKSGVNNEWFENGSRKSEGMYIDGKKEGALIEYYENTNRKYSAEYFKDQLNGKSQNFYSNGELKNSTDFVNGQKNGKYTEWHENGKLRKELVFEKDKVSDGTIIEYDNLGFKLMELECKSGVINSEYTYKDSKQTEYYDYQLGKKKSEGSLINGTKEGQWTEWFPSGQKSFEGSYKQGKRDGKGIAYSQDGSVNWDGEIKDGNFHGKGILNEKNIKYDGVWDMGKKNGDFVEIDNLMIKSEGEYVFDKKEGLWTEFFLNGNKKKEARYNSGNLVNGEYSEWYDNGQKKEEKTYLNSQLNGKHTLWFQNGTVESSMIYLNGKVSDGNYFYFDSNGNITKEINFMNGVKRSEYTYSGKLKNGYFVEYYADGSKKIEGTYESGKRKVGERYGANKRTSQFFKGMGSLLLVIVIVAASTVI